MHKSGQVSRDLRALLSAMWSGSFKRFGGAKRDRTADLYNAIVALSQLSYSPFTLMPHNPPDISCQICVVAPRQSADAIVYPSACERRKQKCGPSEKS